MELYKRFFIETNCHLLQFAIMKKLKWRKIPIYFAAQYLGAWVASAVIMLIYYGEKKSVIQFKYMAMIINEENQNLFHALLLIEQTPRTHILFINNIIHFNNVLKISMKKCQINI